MQERIYEEYEMTYSDCLPFKNQGEDFDSLCSRADSFIAIGDADNLRKVVNEMLEKHPSESKGYVYYVKSHMISHEIEEIYEEALDIFLRTQEKYRDPEANLLLDLEEDMKDVLYYAGTLEDEYYSLLNVSKTYFKRQSS